MSARHPLTDTEATRGRLLFHGRKFFERQFMLVMRTERSDVFFRSKDVDARDKRGHDDGST
jgi:hypothetical protein